MSFNLKIFGFFVLTQILIARNARSNTHQLEIVKEDFGAVALYAPCSFDNYSTRCHVDSGMRQTEINDKHFSSYPVVKKSSSKDVSGLGVTCNEFVVKKISFQNRTKNDLLVRECGEKRLHKAVLGVDFFANE
jgi:hypothetical protein